MKTVLFDQIVTAVADLCVDSNCALPGRITEYYQRSINDERSPLPVSILEQCVENAQIASERRVPLCQDTGLAVFFIRIGSGVQIDGGSLEAAVNEGVRRGYADGYLRKSVLTDPLFDRKNTGTNTPAILHTEIIDGDELTITIIPKGGGAENSSAIKMLSPSAGVEGVVDFVVDAVLQAGGNPCPPVVLGVGIGSNFEGCALLAKKALLRPVGDPNPDPRYAALEQRILSEVNATGIGPQGLGGNTTAFAVHIEYAPCHLASLPVAVNVNCHIHRILTWRLS
jgi:fumarate hydratase subunit alpha